MEGSSYRPEDEQTWVSNVLNAANVIRDNEELLAIKASTDSLTGLINRNAAEQISANAIEKHADKSFGVFMIDLNGLKILNDTLGHHIGDQLIINAADALTSVARGDNEHDLLNEQIGLRESEDGETRLYDILSRHAGDEFVIFAAIEKDVPQERIAEIKDAINERIESYMDELKKTLTPDILAKLHHQIGHIKHFASVGYAKLDITDSADVIANERDVRNAIKLADANMYEDKSEQKNGHSSN